MGIGLIDVVYAECIVKLLAYAFDNRKVVN
jgi:hypothetical protein